jgi:four helix bundle protein
LKSLDESEFWLQLIIDKKLIQEEKIIPILKEANELTSIFVSSRKIASLALKNNNYG